MRSTCSPKCYLNTSWKHKRFVLFMPVSLYWFTNLAIIFRKKSGLKTRHVCEVSCPLMVMQVIRWPKLTLQTGLKVADRHTDKAIYNLKQSTPHHFIQGCKKNKYGWYDWLPQTMEMSHVIAGLSKVSPFILSVTQSCKMAQSQIIFHCHKTF